MFKEVLRQKITPITVREGDALILSHNEIPVADIRIGPKGAGTYDHAIIFQYQNGDIENAIGGMFAKVRD